MFEGDPGTGFKIRPGNCFIFSDNQRAFLLFHSFGPILFAPVNVKLPDG